MNGEQLIIRTRSLGSCLILLAASLFMNTTPAMSKTIVFARELPMWRPNASSISPNDVSEIVPSKRSLTVLSLSKFSVILSMTCGRARCMPLG